MIIKKQRLILFFIFLITSCAPPRTPDSHVNPPPHTPQSNAARINAAKHLSLWTITGAVAAKNNRKAWTASMNWKQQGLNRYRLRLFGPLGGGSVLVEKKGRLITYQDGPKRVTTTNIDQLFYKETGVRVPLHNLYYWVRGVKAPGAIQSSEHDALGHFLTLKQGGYTVQYENYQTIKGVDLPTKLRVTGPGGHLKLIIKHWKID